jgi:hypothetical protein
MEKFISMKEVSLEDYKDFVKNCKEVEIEDVKLTIGMTKNIKEL